jgi:putative transposase
MAIKRCQGQFGFKLYGLCIMSNHVHYLLEPAAAGGFAQNHALAELVYSHVLLTTCMLNRTGHFWEKRYHSTGFPIDDKRRALNTCAIFMPTPRRPICSRAGFYDFSNYGTMIA